MTGSDWVGSDSPSLLMAYTSNLYRWPGLRLRTVVEVAGAVTCNQTLISRQSRSGLTLTSQAVIHSAQSRSINLKVRHREPVSFSAANQKAGCEYYDQ